MALVTITTEGEEPTLQLAAAQLHVAVEDIDSVFGFVKTNPTTHSYAVKVRADRLPPDFASGKPFAGPFADVPIVSLATKPKEPLD